MCIFRKKLICFSEYYLRASFRENRRLWRRHILALHLCLYVSLELSGCVFVFGWVCVYALEIGPTCRWISVWFFEIVCDKVREKLLTENTCKINDEHKTNKIFFSLFISAIFSFAPTIKGVSSIFALSVSPNFRSNKTTGATKSL